MERLAVFLDGGDHRLGVLMAIDIQNGETENGRQKQHRHDGENTHRLPVSAS